jgi:hypothetical protein
MAMTASTIINSINVKPLDAKSDFCWVGILPPVARLVDPKLSQPTHAPARETLLSSRSSAPVPQASTSGTDEMVAKFCLLLYQGNLIFLSG